MKDTHMSQRESEHQNPIIGFDNSNSNGNNNVTGIVAIKFLGFGVKKNCYRCYDQ